MDDDENEITETLDDDNYISLSGSSVHSEDENVNEMDFFLSLVHQPREPIEEVAHFHDNINMDLSLPGMHSYLNKDMEQIIGRTILDSDTVYEMFLFWRPHVILVPGQKMPLHLTPHQADMFIHARETNKIVGFIACPIDTIDLNSCVGTTAELMSIRIEEDNVTAMVIGRQRFRTISVHRRSDNELRHSNYHPLQNSVPLSWRKYGSSARKYRIDTCSHHYESLPSNVAVQEPPATPTTNNSGSLITRLFRRHSSRTQKPSLSANTVPAETIIRQNPLIMISGDPVALLSSDQSTWLTDTQMKQSQQIITPAVDSQGRQFSFARSNHCRCRESRLPARRDVLAATAHSMGIFPSWVYEMYDMENLIGKVTKELKEWNTTWQLDHWTEEIGVQFSYWLVQNLPVPDAHKIAVLEINHVVPRLQACLKLLLKCSNFHCENCQQEITSKQKIVCLATEGSLQTFVNPHGHLHEMVTVSGVVNVHTVGRSTEEYSWFPG